VGEESWAGTEGKVVVLADVFTVTSKRPDAVDAIWTVTGSLEAVSVRRRMVRSYLSPPNRRDDREVQGDALLAAVGVGWSRRAMKSAA